MATALTRPAEAPASAGFFVPEGSRGTFGRDLAAFLDAIHTATGRATHDNTAEEQLAAEAAAHDQLARHDALLYGLLLTLPGVQDRARQAGLLRMLSGPPIGSSRLQVEHPAAIAAAVAVALARSLPTPRLLRALARLREGRINTGRARRFVLRTLLGSRDLPFWSVKYRGTLKAVLRHAMGEKIFGVAATIGARPSYTWSVNERRIIARHVIRWSGPWGTVTPVCLAYLAGREIAPALLSGARLRIIGEVAEARADLAAGDKLPVEVLEGIRSTYHRERPHADVLAIAGRTMTAKQAAGAQKEAKRAGVAVEFDPRQVPPEKLYVLAFEQGSLTAEMVRALDEHAERAVAAFPLRHEQVVVVLDASASMAGPEARPIGNRKVSEQKWHPIAAALALTDVLVQVGSRAEIRIAGGGKREGRLVYPQGATDLAGTVLEAFRLRPDAIYLISDGYENAPAGRVAELITRVREIGIETPVIHVNPVLAAEAVGTRSLLPGLPAIPAARPSALSAQVLRGMLEQDPVTVAATLAGQALRLLEAPG
jgi:hypothetical protein